MSKVPPLKSYRREKRISLEGLGARFGVNKTTVRYWERKRVPAERVLEIERETGVSRHELRPDLYPPPNEGRAA